MNSAEMLAKAGVITSAVAVYLALLAFFLSLIPELSREALTNSNNR
jgi:hypothetical protein